MSVSISNEQEKTLVSAKVKLQFERVFLTQFSSRLRYIEWKGRKRWILRIGKSAKSGYGHYAYCCGSRGCGCIGIDSRGDWGCDGTWQDVGHGESNFGDDGDGNSGDDVEIFVKMVMGKEVISTMVTAMDMKAVHMMMVM